MYSRSMTTKKVFISLLIAFIFFIVTPQHSNAQTCCAWDTRTTCTTDSMAYACDGPSSCGQYVCPLYCFCSTETYCTEYCSPPGGGGGDNGGGGNNGGGGGNEYPTPTPLPTPTFTPTPIPVPITGRVRGKVYIDINKNGIYEASIDEYYCGPSATIQLHQDGVLQNSATSFPCGGGSAAGDYSLNDRRGSYEIRLVLPNGYTNTSPTSKDITITNGGNITVNFGIILAGDLTISPADDFNLRDSNGQLKGTADNPFFVGEPVYPVTYISNIGSGPANSADGKTYTRFYRDEPNTLPPNQYSSVQIISNIFEPGWRIRYSCAPFSSNNCASFSPNSYWNPTTAGTFTARAYVNFNESNAETNYSNNQMTRTYTVVDPYYIYGRAFVDFNKNGNNDSGEAALAGLSVQLQTSAGTVVTNTTTDSDGVYHFGPVKAGDYVVVSIATSATADYNRTTGGYYWAAPRTGDVTGLNFGFYPKYYLAGHVFVDINEDKVKNGDEQNYAASPAISISPSNGAIQITENSNGSYSIIGLTSRNYTISYNSLPSGYYMSHPHNGPPPSFNVAIGTGCSTGTPNPGGTCTNGNLSEINFGISPANPWFQAYGLDVRFDDGLNNPIPPTPNAACGGAYALRPSSSATPGIAFSGGTTAFLGQGQASSNPYNWLVGSSSYPEIFSPVQIGIVHSSYGALLDKVKKAGVTSVNLATVCTLTNCTLPSNLSEGAYQANGDLTLNAYTFPGGRDYVFLINGNLRVQGNIDIPVGSTATFATTQSISIQSNVGQTPACPAPASAQVDGFFSAGKDFIVGTNANCSAGEADLQLNLQGAIVTNASQTNGGFVNNRDLCTGNANFPSFTIRERPDFILNAPPYLKAPNIIYQEVAS